MQLTPERTGTEQTTERTKAACQPRCPVCSGPLVEQRSAMRCSRCYFTICEGCSGDAGDAFAGASD